MSDGAAQPRKSLRSLWLIVALTTAPVIASYLLYYFWPPSHTVNYGELIEPRLLPDPPLARHDGAPFRLSQLRGRWLLVAIGPGACDPACEQQLLYMRQLRLTQGKERDRIERVWLMTDDAVPRPALRAAAEGTWFVHARDPELLGRFAAAGATAGHLYVVDPLGNLMMRFPRDPDPKRMIKDLARLLKASQIG